MISQCRLAIAAAILLAVGQQAGAQDFLFKQHVVGLKPSKWAATSPTYGDWIPAGDIYGCSNWSPSPDTVTVNQHFTQTATDCKQDETRSVQHREQEYYSKAVRDVGSPGSEKQTVITSSTRSAIGAKETWNPVTPSYTEWTYSGAIYGCSTWSPAPATVTVGTTFTQSATDCKQDQTRTRQDREYETTIGEYRDVGAPISEGRVVAASSTQQAIGTKETWVSYASSYDSWSNSGSPYNCSAWSPAASTITTGTAFTQSRSCAQNQSRTVQERERETTLDTVRNKGVASTEAQTISVSQSQQATGTKETWVSYAAVYGSWTNSGSAYSCGSWSPAASTITTGTAFTQSRSCSQNQSRTVQERERESTLGTVRNKGAASSEAQTISVSQSQQATGTKETWVSYAAVYGSWTNSGSAYSCGSWSPAASTINAGTSFTQSRSCSQNQVRTVQERERETTLGTVRNKGAARSEAQTISVSQSQQATGTKASKVCKGEPVNYGLLRMSNTYFVVWAGEFLTSSTSQTISHGGYRYSTNGVKVPGTQMTHICREPL